MTNDDKLVQTLLAEIKDIATAGFAVALHVGFNSPKLLFQTYPPKWLKEYSENGLVMNDPTVHWGFENTGLIRWSDLDDADATGVLRKAADHGLVYGLTWSTETQGTRSIGSFARSDRDFLPAECEILQKLAQRLHDETVQLTALSDTTGEKLRQMSIRYTHSVEE
ncbi:MAG: autoinducer binding domain-containing protein [Loktanella sp.]|nr:autoinducer binding domain-containing protein [Loktanella sp.]